ncbi:type II secretion system protein N [Desulfoscipio gibsoniae]|uniref:Type II secretion system protein GspC N-terminal domain-containing protein n=1 Tax=Desulfoscipio gibsoniae DSM 7213 TaxID=767817 RepID=R4KKF7_9FIRM|nr:type II secretion system protein N [Desulfoscipio gibsoniae]AGL02057.1 hypothetical protein Desgi_2652 [Desulfoscipio gibsoniae DSM 7213]
MASKISREQITSFIEKNKKSVILGGVLLVIVLVGLVLVIKLNYGFINGAAEDQTQQPNSMAADKEQKASAGAVTTYLPETKRKIEDTGTEPRDPFARNMTLKGIIVGGNSSLAIIESGSTAYIAGVGEKITADWTVAKITGDEVVLKSGTQTMRLEFQGNTK